MWEERSRKSLAFASQPEQAVKLYPSHPHDLREFKGG
jgi:hypothetical protein